MEQIIWSDPAPLDKEDNQNQEDCRQTLLLTMSYIPSSSTTTANVVAASGK